MVSPSTSVSTAICLLLLFATTSCGRVGFELLAEERRTDVNFSDAGSSTRGLESSAEGATVTGVEDWSDQSDTLEAETGMDSQSDPEPQPGSPDTSIANDDGVRSDDSDAASDDVTAEGSETLDPEPEQLPTSSDLGTSETSEASEGDVTGASGGSDRDAGTGSGGSGSTPVLDAATNPQPSDGTGTTSADTMAETPTVEAGAGTSDVETTASPQLDASTTIDLDAAVDASSPGASDAGACQETNLGVESCDGVDNDCDLSVDEDGCPANCRGEATDSNGYMLCDDLVIWSDAQAACEAQGLTLVTIDSAELNLELQALMYPEDGSLDQLYFWTGASRVDSSSPWTWEDGATWGTYANWKNGVPGNAGTANCIQVDDEALWFAGQCSQTKRYACELTPRP